MKPAPGSARTSPAAHPAVELPATGLRGLHLHLEPIGGMAGDMFLGAMIDCGVPESVVADAVRALGLADVAVETRRATRGGVDGVRFRVLMAGAPLEGPDPEEAPEGGPLDEPGRADAPAETLDTDLEGASRILERSGLAGPVRRRALRMVRRLAEAVARTDGVAAEEVRFAGRAGVDFLADLVGSAAVVEWLAPTGVTCGPVHVGGAVDGGPGGADHSASSGRSARSAPVGRSPAAGPSVPCDPIGGGGEPATGSLWLLGDAPTISSPGGERLTPTGAVVLADLVDRFGPAPGLVPVAEGVGLGRAETVDCPNVVEARLVVPDDAPARPERRA